MNVDRELQFVISSVKGEVEFGEGMDLRKVKVYTSIHRLWGWVYKNGRGVPEDLREWLEREILKIEGFYHMCEETVKEISSVLDVKWYIIKGFATSRLYYPQRFLRPISDIDIIVSENSYNYALNKLLNCGFKIRRRGRWQKWSVLVHPSFAVEVDLVTPAAAGIPENFLEKFSTDSIHLSHEGNACVALAHILKNLFERSLLDFVDILQIRKNEGEKTLMSVFRAAPRYERVFQLSERIFEFLSGREGGGFPWWLRFRGGDVVSVRNPVMKKIIGALI